MRTKHNIYKSIQLRTYIYMNLGEGTILHIVHIMETNQLYKYSSIQYMYMQNSNMHCKSMIEKSNITNKSRIKN